MKNFRKKISWQIGSWFFILAVLPSAIGAMIVHHNTYNLIVKESTTHLVDIIYEKINHIEEYVRERKQIVKTLSTVPVVIQTLQEAAHTNHRRLQKWRLPFLDEARQQLDYHDILLINQAGDIVYSTLQEGAFGINL
ncbi:MAG: hypothetical protein D3923_17525, partial [Candidatus Electrothrix sp. AR3]|nr:hypothetical protein [Candidatus Electrothrix sp. AR3]